MTLRDRWRHKPEALRGTMAFGNGAYENMRVAIAMNKECGARLLHEGDALNKACTKRQGHRQAT